jgi:AraC-like DNA-binding protein
MKFEFTVGPGFNFLTAFAEKFKVRVFRHSLHVPASMGKGFIKFIELEPGCKLVLHHYTLKQAFHLKRLPSAAPNNLVSIVFNSNEIPTDGGTERENTLQFLKTYGSAIQVSSSALGTETQFAKNTEVYFVVIGITTSLLSSMLNIEKQHSLVQKILTGSESFFFHENMSADAKNILKQLSAINEQDELSTLYYKIKVQELLYGLFSKLLARERSQHSIVNKSDIEKLYTIRTAILADVSMPPKLKDLAKMSGMSETKMKQLFKQVFGDTIYNYYQKTRMEEAAFLLRQAGYSVSETGYHLGFSNLSHFSRLFEKQFGLTPKKYSTTG